MIQGNERMKKTFNQCVKDKWTTLMAQKSDPQQLEFLQNYQSGHRLVNKHAGCLIM